MNTVKNINGIENKINLQKKTVSSGQSNYRKKPGSAARVTDSLVISEAAARMMNNKAELERFVDIVKNARSSFEKELTAIESGIDERIYDGPGVTEAVSNSLKDLPYFKGQRPETIAGFINTNEWIDSAVTS